MARVIVADYMLSDSMDGIDLATELRKRSPRLATVLVTGYLSPISRARARKVGVAVVLAKPFSLGELRNAVRTAVQAKRKMRGGR